MMNAIQRIILGLQIFEKYNSTTVPDDGSSKFIMKVQEVEFNEISAEDIKILNSIGWSNDVKSPYLWKLSRQ